MNLHEQIVRIKSIMGIIQEGEEHIRNLYKSWANKKSGNPEEAMKNIDYVISNRKRLPKKDFSNYNSYEELFQDLTQINKTKLDDDITEFYRGDIKNGDDLLVFAANTWESSCKYGAGSKWCTTSRTNSSDWERHNNTGTEFFWVFRNKPQDDPNHKFSFHIKIDGDTDWCNAINNCQAKIPDDSYPKQHPKFIEIIEKLKEFNESRGLKEKREKLKTLEERNIDFIHDWVQNNSQEILTELKRIISIKSLNEELSFTFSLDMDVEEFLPYDEEEQYDFINDLEEYIRQQNFYSSDLFNEDFINTQVLISTFLKTLINDFNLDYTNPFNQQISDNQITIERIINSESFKNNLIESLDDEYHESIHYFFSEKIEEFVSNWDM
jgi:hypothetical protein